MYITLDFPRWGGADNSISDLSGTCLQFGVSIFGKTFGTNFKVWVKSLQQTSQKLLILQNRSNLSWRLLCESKTVTSYPWFFENSYILFQIFFTTGSRKFPLVVTSYLYIYYCPLLWTESCRWLLWCINVIPLDLDLFVTHLLSSKSILTGLWSEILNTVSEKICQYQKQVHEWKMF